MVARRSRGGREEVAFLRGATNMKQLAAAGDELATTQPLPTQGRMEKRDGRRGWRAAPEEEKGVRSRSGRRSDEERKGGREGEREGEREEGKRRAGFPSRYVIIAGGSAVLLSGPRSFARRSTLDQLHRSPFTCWLCLACLALSSTGCTLQ
jgi:hypothetical protein